MFRSGQVLIGLVALIPTALIALAVRPAVAQEIGAQEEAIRTVTEAENIPSHAESAPADATSLPAPRGAASAQPSQAGGLFERAPRPTPRVAATAATPLGLVLANTANRRVRVRDVQSGSVAAQAGVRPQDLLISIAGQPIESDEQFARALADLRTRRSNPRSNAIPLIVQREGSLLTLQVNSDAIARMDTRPRGSSVDRPRPVRRIPQTLTRRQGDNATGDESGYLGIELDPRFPQAAIVARVTPNSAAAKAGLQAGDRIYALNQQPINSSAELVAWIAELNAGEEIDVKFDRPQNARVTLGTRPANAVAAPKATSDNPADAELPGWPEASPGAAAEPTSDSPVGAAPSSEFKELPKP